MLRRLFDWFLGQSTCNIKIEVFVHAVEIHTTGSIDIKGQAFKIESPATQVKYESVREQDISGFKIVNTASHDESIVLDGFEERLNALSSQGKGRSESEVPFGSTISE